MRLTLIVPVLLATVKVVQATAFLQCANVAIQIALFPAVINIVTTMLSPANSYSGCPVYCKDQQGTKYSMYQPGLLGLLGTCYCVNNDPRGNYVLSGTNSAGSCAIAQFQIHYLNDNRFALQRCQTAGVYTGGLPAITVTNQGDCFTRCQSTAFMVINTNSAGVISCTCPMNAIGGSAAVCGVGTQNLYKNNAVTASEGARRRRDLIANEIQEAAQRDAYCPHGLTACRIEGAADDAYECLYTASELESCGGCVNGYVGNTTALIGEDCTKMPGALRGSISCIDGRCVTRTCHAGFVQVRGRCAPALVGQE